MGFDILSFAMGRASGGDSNIELLENLQIPVDFSEGNQNIYAPDGTAVKSAVIQKPTNLVAENIAEGVDIAGIVGTLAVGGGSKTYKRYTGSFTANTGVQTVNHGIGEVPDFVLILPQFTPEALKLTFAVGYSQAMVDKLGGGYFNRASGLTSGSGSITLSSNEGIDKPNTTYAAYGVIRDTTENQFTVGGTTFALKTGANYSWEAITGLT